MSHEIELSVQGNRHEGREDEVYEDIRSAVTEARAKVVRAANAAMVQAYWEIGRRIAEEQRERAEYGKHLMDYLSKRLTAEFGRGFDKKNLYRMKQFFLAYPNVAIVSRQLSWSHYVKLLTVEDDAARAWYTKDAAERHLSVRELRRCIETRTCQLLGILRLQMAWGCWQLSTSRASPPRRSSRWLSVDDRRVC